MNEKQALQDVENALRDFISSMLEKKYVEEWIHKCGMPEDRIKKWQEKKEAEHKKQKFSSCDPRLIYYSDFYDLGNLLNKNWDLFSVALGEKKQIEVFLKLLEDYRNASAHGRELLTYQKHLVLGVTGEIRNRITKFRSMQETGESYFPRIESIHDNYGNSWKTGDRNLKTGLILRVGDILEFVVSATDPRDEPIEYNLLGSAVWHTDNHLQLQLGNEHVRAQLSIGIRIRSSREHHANRDYDDMILFKYQVLPPK